jgi:hypothetical protein
VRSIFSFPFAGYGHIAPSTVLGKFFTMLYTIIGIPLFLLYISSIGDIMATSFKWTYSRNNDDISYCCSLVALECKFV